MNMEPLLIAATCALVVQVSPVIGDLENTSRKSVNQKTLDEGEMRSFLETLDFDLLWSVRDDLLPHYQELVWQRLLKVGNVTDGHSASAAMGYLMDLGKQWVAMNRITEEKIRLGKHAKKEASQQWTINLLGAIGEDSKASEVSVPLFKRLSSFAFNGNSPFLADPNLALEFFDALFKAQIPDEDRVLVVSAIRLMFDLSVPIVAEKDDWPQVWLQSEGRRMLADAVLANEGR
jgi:hypothetical protein